MPKKRQLPLLEQQQQNKSPEQQKRKEMLPPLQQQQQQQKKWFGSDKQFVTFSATGGCTIPARRKTQFQSPISQSQRWNTANPKLPNFPSTNGDGAGPIEKQTAETNGGGSANSSQQMENVFCSPSQLQKDLHSSVQYLMTMRDSEQQKLQRLICNHPILLYLKVLDLSGNLRHQATKKAKKEFVNFSGVICHFPTRYELCQCRIEDSGKLLKLFEMATERTTDRLIIASNYIKTLELLDSLFGLLHEHFAVFRINPNTPATALPQIERQILEEPAQRQHQIILISSKMERLSAKLFHSSRLIFYDFDPFNDVRTVTKWGAEGVLKSVQRLITLDTFEADEFSSSDGDNFRPTSQPFD